jgi:hypothetical protein
MIGNQTGRNSTANYNILMGEATGWCITSGACNLFLGTNAGLSNVTGSNNIAIGFNAGSGGSPSGLIAITGSNCIVMGNANHTTACIQIAWGVASDIRYKCVYGAVPYGRDFLRGVNPIKYSFKDKETGEVKDPRKRYGFSAQEVMSLEGDEPIIVNNSDPDNLGITHDYMIPVLVNAIKELDQENQDLKARIEALENKLNT